MNCRVFGAEDWKLFPISEINAIYFIELLQIH